MAYNLTSPTGLLEPCDLGDLEGWFNRELCQVPSDAERHILDTVARSLNSFVRWPDRALLLWQGCDRVPEEGQRLKYFRYPDSIKAAAKQSSVPLDTRQNGPAIAAFFLAGGARPKRYGSSNAWSIHHLFSGKFPYPGTSTTTHAAKSGLHFTQSAGLVAAHPIADAIVDEFPFFAWLLRAIAFQRFGYDPDHVFGGSTNELGFAPGYSCDIMAPAA